MAGEFPSIRAAAIEAGIIKLVAPINQLRKAWAKCSAAERAEFLSEIR